MTTDRRYSFHSLAVVLALAATPITAQGSSAVFSDTVDVEVVNIEIVVTDKDGQPVTGLTVDDFRLFEDGARGRHADQNGFEREQATRQRRQVDDRGLELIDDGLRARLARGTAREVRHSQRMRV